MNSPAQLWLFEEPQVTQSEVAAWVKKAIGLTLSSWRFDGYVRQWAVVDKIRIEKINHA